MSNPRTQYNEYVRANLPSGMTFDYDLARYRYNNHSFASFWVANIYYKYIQKFGGGLPLLVLSSPPTQVLNTGTLVSSISGFAVTDTTPTADTATLRVNGYVQAGGYALQTGDNVTVLYSKADYESLTGTVDAYVAEAASDTVGPALSITANGFDSNGDLLLDIGVTDDSTPVTIDGVITDLALGEPSAPQIRAGQAADGSAADYTFQISLSASGSETISSVTLADGDYRISIAGTDNVGNEGAAAHDTFNFTAGPLISVFDFDGLADGTDLQDEADWSEVVNFQGITMDHTVTGGVPYLNPTTPADNDFQAYLTGATEVLAADRFIEGTIEVPPSNNSNDILILSPRALDTANYYRVQVRVSSIRMQSTVGGSSANDGIINHSGNFVAGDVIRIEVTNGNDLEVFINGSSVRTWTPSALAGGDGVVGFGNIVNNGGGGAAFTQIRYGEL